jgi:hypothetical protein
VRTRHAILATAVLLAALATLTIPRFGQPPGYHQMADERAMAGVPNAMNVLSNIPFAVVGIIGLVRVIRLTTTSADPRDVLPYVALFAGVLLTSIGSSYYHLQPDNERLVWDRLPMTIGFVGLLAALITERVNAAVGRALLVPLVLAGIASVVYWHWSESRGAGDLRPYALVQFGSLLIVLLVLALYPRRDAGTGYLLAGVGIYLLSKALELWDREIFGITSVVSGHTLKHLAAAAGIWCILLMVRNRSPFVPSPPRSAPTGL